MKSDDLAGHGGALRRALTWRAEMQVFRSTDCAATDLTIRPAGVTQGMPPGFFNESHSRRSPGAIASSLGMARSNARPIAAVEPAMSRRSDDVVFEGFGFRAIDQAN
ncbi:hypothetical protein [Pseudacidovorax sp. RU35E]|uniref:hypothetical protein n=1 Tax=Pseudacidovorax sp. RU35E TaxID=1907403 RepID=UPI00117B7900|nr:hypothetical protein [Pseudacidovorax sp. RU35E]